MISHGIYDRCGAFVKYRILIILQALHWSPELFSCSLTLYKISFNIYKGISHRYLNFSHNLSNMHIYYIKLQCPFVCLYPPPLFPTRPSDRNQIWHTYSGRYGTHSQLNKFDPAHPRGNITSYVTSSNVEDVRHLKTTARRSMT